MIAHPIYGKVLPDLPEGYSWRIGATENRTLDGSQLGAAIVRRRATESAFAGDSVAFAKVDPEDYATGSEALAAVTAQALQSFERVHRAERVLDEAIRLAKEAGA